jgi:hypothetical protein
MQDIRWIAQLSMKRLYSPMANSRSGAMDVVDGAKKPGAVASTLGEIQRVEDVDPRQFLQFCKRCHAEETTSGRPEIKH